MSQPRREYSRYAFLADILPFLVEDEFLAESQPEKRRGLWWLFSRDHVFTNHSENTLEAAEWGVAAALQAQLLGLHAIAEEEGIQTWFISRGRRSLDGFERTMMSKEINVQIAESRTGKRGFFGLGGGT